MFKRGAGPRGRMGALKQLGMYGGASILTHAVLAASMVLLLGPRPGLLQKTNDNYAGDPGATIAGIELRDPPQSSPARDPAVLASVIKSVAARAVVAATPRRHATPSRPRLHSAPTVPVQPPTREADPDAEPDAESDSDTMPDPFETEGMPMAAAGDSLRTASVTITALRSSRDQPAENQAIEVAASEAQYLRTYEAYPSLPRSLWVTGRVYAVLAQVCVAVDGGVSTVSIRNGSAPELDRLITASVRSWRYRPRVVEGAARPFCHLMKFVYSTR
jgi:hypothetical protein